MASAAEQLCLTWSDFSNSTWDMLRNLLMRGELADVTLVADDGRLIRTHKFMLKSCSSFFQSILTSVDQANPIIFLTNIRLKEIQNLLKFMYLGQVFLEEADLNLFMTAAEKLKIKGLSAMSAGQQSQEAERKNLDLTGLSDAVDQDISLTLFDQSGDGRTESVPGESQERKAAKVKHEYLDFSAETIFSSQAQTLPGNLRLSEAGDCPVPGDRPDDKVLVEAVPRVNTSQVYHECGQCDYKSTKLFNVKKHRAAVHEGVRYPCDQCDYKATETGHLKKHIRSRHQVKE